MINPRVVADDFVRANMKTEEVLEQLPGVDPERLQKARQLNGPHLPPGGPPLRHDGLETAYQSQLIAALAEALAAHHERIVQLEEALADKKATRPTTKKQETKIH